MSRTRHWLFGMVGLLVALCVDAQPPATVRQATAQQAVVDYSEVNFRRYGVEHGLSQSSVVALAQDGQGYLWVGTQDGLNRFDGYGFRVYRNQSGDPHSLPGNSVFALAPSRLGGVWVGTGGGGLARYRPETDSFIHYPMALKKELRGDLIYQIEEMPNGQVWVAGSIAGIQRFDPASARYIPLAPEAASQVGGVQVMQRLGNDLLIGTPTGVFKLHTSTGRVQPWSRVPQAAQALAMTIGPDGKDVWVGTKEGILRLSLAGELLQSWPRVGEAAREYGDLQFDRRGQLWMGDTHGLTRLDVRTGAIRTWRHGSGLPGALASSSVHALLLDRDGLLWIGAWLNGLSMIAPEAQGFGSLRVQSGRDDAADQIAVISLIAEKDGSVWMGLTENQGVVHYDFGKGVLEHFRHDPADRRSIPPGLVLALLKDRDGRLWVGTDLGLAVQRSDGFHTFEHRPDDPASRAEATTPALYQDRGGTVWVSGSNNTLASICSGCSGFRRYSVSPFAGRGNHRVGSIMDMLEDSRGDFWLAGFGDGLRRLDRKTGRLESFNDNVGKPGYMSHSNVSTITEDARGVLWVGTQGGGINRVEIDRDRKPRFSSWSIDAGFASAAIGGIVPDAEGKLWVSTSAGLSHFDPVNGRVVNYSGSAGAQPSGYFFGAAAPLPGGRAIFGGFDGATVVNPKGLLELPVPHRVVITSLQRPQRRQGNAYELRADAFLPREDGQVVLPPESDDFTLSFSALTYIDPLSVEYIYRLVGVDEGWIGVSAQDRRVSYTNLAPGRYRFEVRARHPHGEWSEISSIPIQLLAPWWRTSWAKLGYVLLVLLMVTAIGWEMRQRQRERAKARRKIADSEQRLKLALWATGDEMWEVNLPRKELHRLNPLDATGETSETVIEDITGLRRDIHPDDLTTFDSSFDEHVSGHTPFFEVAYRVLDSQDRWRWHLSRGRVVERGENSAPVRIAGATSDITRQKTSENALGRINAELESRVRLRTEALEDAHANLRQLSDTLRRCELMLADADQRALLGDAVRRLRPATSEASAVPGGVEGEPSNALDACDRLLRDLNHGVPRDIDVCDLLNTLIATLQPRLHSDDQRVKLQCTPGLTVNASPAVMQQVLMQMLVHALQAPAINVRVTADLQRGQAVIEVTDPSIATGNSDPRGLFDLPASTERTLYIASRLTTYALHGSLENHIADGRQAVRLSLPGRIAG